MAKDFFFANFPLSNPLSSLHSFTIKYKLEAFHALSSAHLLRFHILKALQAFVLLKPPPWILIEFDQIGFPFLVSIRPCEV